MVTIIGSGAEADKEVISETQDTRSKSFKCRHWQDKRYNCKSTDIQKFNQTSMSFQCLCEHFEQFLFSFQAVGFTTSKKGALWNHLSWSFISCCAFVPFSPHFTFRGWYHRHFICCSVPVSIFCNKWSNIWHQKRNNSCDVRLFFILPTANTNIIYWDICKLISLRKRTQPTRLTRMIYLFPTSFYST